MAGFHYVDSLTSANASAYSLYNPSESTKLVNAPTFTLSQANTSLSSRRSSAPDNTGNQGSDTDSYEGRGISTADIEKIYEAMYQMGTNDPDFEAVLNKVNKDNVMDLMMGWNDLHSAEKGESFMKAFMWDADSDQKVKYGRKINNALKAKAKEVGIYDELADKFAKIDAELSSTAYINNDICETYDEIIEKIAVADSRKKLKAAYKVDANGRQKADYGKKVAAALEAKAKEVGVYDSLSVQFNRLNGALDALENNDGYIDQDISDAFDKIIDQIAEAEGSKQGKGKPRDCYDGFVGAMETCKEYGLLGGLAAGIVEGAYGLVKGIVDIFI